MSNAAIRELIRNEIMSESEIDPWGSGRAAAFAVADNLSIRRLDVPAEMEYQPSPAMKHWGVFADEDYASESLSELVEFEYDCVPVDRIGEELTYWVRVLNRYVSVCELAGRDY